MRSSLVRINRGLPVEAIGEALAKLKNFDTGSLLQNNIIFMDYLQNGITVKFFVKASTMLEKQVFVGPPRRMKKRQAFCMEALLLYLW
mgnify:CR=1 FL=1